MTFGLAGADLCRKEMPNVVEAYKAFKDKGFGIVGVSLDENADKWKEAITALILHGHKCLTYKVGTMQVQNFMASIQFLLLYWLIRRVPL